MLVSTIHPPPGFGSHRSGLVSASRPSRSSCLVLARLCTEAPSEPSPPPCSLHRSSLHLSSSSNSRSSSSSSSRHASSLTAGIIRDPRSPTCGGSVALSPLRKMVLRSGSRSRGHARLVCQAKKSSGSASTKTKKKTSGGTASLSTSVRKSLVEEVLKEERKLSGGNNILPAGGLSRSSRQHRALVLDSAYRPINVWSWSKAVMMDVLQRCDVIEYYPPPAHALSGRGLHKLPAVVRVEKYVDVNELCQQVSCTPRNVLMRDKFCCQYCGSKQHLTLDHIVPLSKGGKNTWGNLITACMPCNQKKGDKLLSQLGWKTIGPPPREPKPHEVGFVAGLRMRDLVKPPEIWSLFLEPYRARMGGLLEHIKTTGEDDLLDDE